MSYTLLHKLESWLLNHGEIGQMREFQTSMRGHGDRFQRLHNGYNNAHEALHLMRLASLHLMIARINGEHEDVLGFRDSFHALQQLMTDTLDDSEMAKREFMSQKQAKARACRVLPPLQ